MKAKMQDYKRINFQLTLSLAREFELAAEKGGVTKAKLLRKWLLNPNSTVKTIHSYEPVTNFNLRLSNADIHNLAIASAKAGLKHSHYLRTLITANLAKVNWQ